MSKCMVFSPHSKREVLLLEILRDFDAFSTFTARVFSSLKNKILDIPLMSHKIAGMTGSPCAQS